MTNAARGSPGAEQQETTMRRFRNCAIFWIFIVVAYFAAVGIYLDISHTPLASVTPVLVLLASCLIMGGIWHAAATAAIVVLEGIDHRSRNGTDHWSA